MDQLITTLGYSTARVCKTLGISRNAWYHWRKTAKPQETRELQLKEKIELIILKFPGYGYRRVTRALAREGTVFNHKKIQAVMAKYSLLCLTKTRYLVTTDSDHNHAIYPNLIKRVAPAGVNQIWVADITYIQTNEGFVYPAFIMDIFSRKIIGFNLDRDLSAGLVVPALSMAIARRQMTTELVHHSDRGVQYACGEYVGILQANAIKISMSAKGNPYDNAYAESFVKTLKRDEVHLHEYETAQEAKLRIACYITNVYNTARLHSALGYRSPVEFENLSLLTNLTVPN